MGSAVSLSSGIRLALPVFKEDFLISSEHSIPPISERGRWKRFGRGHFNISIKPAGASGEHLVIAFGFWNRPLDLGASCPEGEECRGQRRHSSRRSRLLPGRPLPTPPTDTLARSLAGARTAPSPAGPAPRRAPHTWQPEPRSPQRDGGGRHRAPRRLARGAPGPDGAATLVDVGPSWRRDHLGRDGRSRAPGVPGFAATSVASSLATGSGEPVA